MWNLLQLELFKIARRPRTYIAFAAISAIVFIFQIAFKADGISYLNLLLQNVDDTIDMEKLKVLNGYSMCYNILNTLLVQVPILVALIAADSISGEANKGTIRLLVSKPVSRSQIIIVKFFASVVYTLLLLIWMAILALFLSLIIFGINDMVVFRTKDELSEILVIPQADVLWRYFAAFSYAAVALTVIAALGLLLSVMAENSIGPIVATVCVVIVFTIVSNINVSLIDKYVKPWLFTSYLVGWKNFFYINVNADNQPITGSIESWYEVKRSLAILVAHIVLFVSLAIYLFKKKDILS